MTIRRSILRVALMTLILGSLSVSLAAMPIKRPAVGAFEWAQSLGRAERNVYLQDSVLRSLPSEYRYALINSIPRGQARGAFWKAAFVAYRDSHEMSSEQLTALNRALDGVSQVVSDIDGSSRTADAYLAWVASLRSAFDPADFDELMYKTSGSTNAGQLPTAERLRYAWRSFRVSVADAIGTAGEPKPKCNCNVATDCGGGFNCDPNVACDSADTDCPGPTSCQRYCMPIPVGQPKH